VGARAAVLGVWGQSPSVGLGAGSNHNNGGGNRQAGRHLQRIDRSTDQAKRHEIDSMGFETFDPQIPKLAGVRVCVPCVKCSIHSSSFGGEDGGQDGMRGLPSPHAIDSHHRLFYPQRQHPERLHTITQKRKAPHKQERPIDPSLGVRAAAHRATFARHNKTKAERGGLLLLLTD